MRRPITSGFLMLALFWGISGITLTAGEANDLAAPGTDKTFEQFTADDSYCRQWAARSSQYAEEMSSQRAIEGAVVGTFLGAGLGAALGAISGDAGLGAAIGAGSGLVLGSIAAADTAVISEADAQRRYESAYQQCMAARGNRVPGAVVKKPGAPGHPPPRTPGAGTGKERYDPPYPFLIRD